MSTNQYAVAFLPNEDAGLRIVNDGQFSNIIEARERAYEAWRCCPDQKVGIYKLAETVNVTFGTVASL